MRFIRTSPLFKSIAVLVFMAMMWQILHPTVAYALTTGPAQPEMQGFEPIGTTDMVDLFTGDFKYNIPLVDVGGYPMNLVYNSGITMDQEASWVGLGWSLNPGSITRNLRGIPDDFNGDVVEETTNIRNNETWSLSVGYMAELLGKDLTEMKELFKDDDPDSRLSLGVFYNNYKGLGIDLNYTPTSLVDKLTRNAEISISAGSQSGLSLTPSLSINHNVKKATQADNKSVPFSTGFASTFNGRHGLTSVTLSGNERTAWKENSNHIERLGGSSTITFCPTYFPGSNYSFTNHSIRLRASLGGEVTFLHPGMSFDGSYAVQGLVNKVRKSKSYGYNHLSEGYQRADALLDFNKEKDGSFSEFSVNTALAGLTHDIYSVKGQGLSGSFRPHRNDVGYVFDQNNGTVNTSANVGAEIGFGAASHNGGNYNSINATTITRSWVDASNVAANKYKFQNRGTLPSATKDEKAVFEEVKYRFSSDKTVSDGEYANYGKERAVELKSHEVFGFRYRLIAGLTQDYGTGWNADAPTKNYTAEQQYLKKNIVALTAEEAQKVSLNKSLTSYFYSPSGSSTVGATHNRVTTVRKAHHISEYQITDESGWTYVYGLPAYNIKHYDVSFATNQSGDCASGLVVYGATENTVDNSAGIDRFYSKRAIPPYVHSYMLTHVLPPDYKDVDGNGVSEKDYGSPVEFKYEKISEVYKWRTPVGNQTNLANYNEALRSMPNDNKANYSYGEKELWYLHKVESKTHVAEFYTSDRDDGLGASNEDGGVSTSVKLRKLDSIKLYSKADIAANGTNAIPIKTVHFEYDYSLTPDVPNRSGVGGKLTLKKLYFTYGNSKRAKLNSYNFYYADYDHDKQMDTGPNGGYLYNPSYRMRAYDRWGNFKPNKAEIHCDSLSNVDEPYTPQHKIPSSDSLYDANKPNRTYADAYAVCWNLTTIDLPSGGVLEVDYEADDYAYVQNRRAMRMFKVVGASDEDDPTTVSNSLYEKGKPKKYLYFKLEEPIEPGTENAADYIQGIDNLFFKFLVNIKNGKQEYVQGYVKFSSFAFVRSDPINSNFDWGRVEVKSVGTKQGSKGELISPILKNALQYTRIFLSPLVYDGSNPNATGKGVLNGLLGLTGVVTDLQSMITGYNRMLIDRKFCRSFDTNASFIRLNSPDYSKKGGGSRVATIRISDEWATMVGTGNGSTASYGQDYSYTITDNNRTISSGVASYEPMIGNEENPFRQPVAYTEERLMAPSNENYVEEPFGEMFFPSPVVGYSKVTVENIEYEDVNRTGTGHSVHAFYTSKDYPTKVSRTPLNSVNKRTNPFTRFLTGNETRLLAGVQGFSIIVNDMHGKPKSNEVFDEAGLKISGSEYIYAETTDGNLSSEVSMIKPDGTISTESFGIETDITNYIKRSDQKTIDYNTQGNLDLAIAFIPIALPSIWFPISGTDHRYRIASTTKLIQQTGILEKVVAHDFASVITTENVLYDYKTGEVLLTKTQNEYEDPVYNYTYPAHWAYNEMDAASSNAGVQIEINGFTSGKVNTTGYNLSDYLTKGDQVIVIKGDGSIGSSTYWVLDFDSNNGDIQLIDRVGQVASVDPQNDRALKIIRSGKSNTPTAPVMTTTSFTDPMTTAHTASPEIITAEAIEYDNYWQTLASGNCEPTYSCSCTANSTLQDDLLTVLNDLAVDSVLFDPIYKYYTTDNRLLVGDPESYPSFTEYLASYMGDDTINYWIVNSTDSRQASGAFLNSSMVGCNLNFTLDEAFNIPNEFIDGVDTLWSEFWHTLEQINYTSLLVDSSTCQATGFRTQAIFQYYNNDNQIQYDTVQMDITNGDSNCYDFGECSQVANETYQVSSGDTVNPFLHGILGRWIPEKNYVYQVDRDYAENSIRYDGIYTSFTPFWDWTSGNLTQTGAANWLSPSEVTKHHPFGFEVENQDILGNFSSAHYGYGNTLPTDVGKNTSYRESGFQSYEDHSLNSECEYAHFQPGQVSWIKNTLAHTGYYSLEVPTSSTATYTSTVIQDNCTSSVSYNWPYVLKDCEVLPGLVPGDRSGTKEYVLSLWYRENDANQVPDYASPSCTLTYNSSTVTLTELYTSPIIEGWQKVDYRFTMPTITNGQEFKLDITNAGAQALYVDDIRIQPFNSEMKGYVYDYQNYRLIAELDENNFATFYEYDNEGVLIRVKKETERGIVTLQETRQHKSQAQ